MGGQSPMLRMPDVFLSRFRRGFLLPVLLAFHAISTAAFVLHFPKLLILTAFPDFVAVLLCRSKRSNPPLLYPTQ